MIDAIYTDYPFYGSRRIMDELDDRFGEHLGRERIRRLMRIMGIEAIYPKPRHNTSVSDNTHTKYPYLLGNITATHPNHIWGTDITYIRLERGWAYLIAYLDWYSRYVVHWELLSSLDAAPCAHALKTALAIGFPKIHNSDQGATFTAKVYIDVFADTSIAISMDGKGRCMDNIFTERLWRTVKYEDVYINSYRTLPEAREGLMKYFLFYNTKRRHQSLERRTPAEYYFADGVRKLPVSAH